MKLTEIKNLLFIDPGAPAPVILSDEHDLYLMYYYYRDIDNTDNKLGLPKERNIETDSGIAVAYFKHVLIYKFGYPNDEVIISHPYYSMGLRAYGMFEVQESDWISEVEQMNKVHPYHRLNQFSNLKHFIVTFKDSTFECIASEVEISFMQLTMKDAVLRIASEGLLQNL